MTRSRITTVLVALTAFSSTLAVMPQGVSQTAPTFGKPTDPDQPGIRWLYADDDTYWKPQDVAIGDRGAGVFCALDINNEKHVLFAGGSARPAFAVPPDTSLPVVRMYADMAEHASLAAALTTVQTEPPPSGLIVPTLTVYDHAGGGEALWSVQLKGSSGYSENGAGVRVSRHGEVVLAWWATTELQGLQIEAFSGDGEPLSSAVLFPMSAVIPLLTDFDLCDDGSRALFADMASKEVIVFDVASGTPELVYQVGLSATPAVHALSGDGLRFVSCEADFLNGNALRIWERWPDGSWGEIRHLTFPFSERIWKVAADRTGGRVAFILQNDSLDGFRVLLYDVESDTILFDHPFDAPGSTLQNVASDLCIDDEGRTVAGSAWGDSMDLTPEIFVFDESGELLRAIDTGGSGRTVDLTPEGDLVIAGSDRTHANVLGPGGDVFLLETRPLALHVSGLPALGHGVSVRVDGGTAGDLAFLAVAEQLLPQPAGDVLLDLSGPSFIWPAFTVGREGAFEAAFHVPQSPALIGWELHAQAVVIDGASGTAGATNQVSLRLLPGPGV